MKTIVIVTDAWFPQVNGVALSVVKMTEQLEQRGFAVHIVHPGLFWSVPLFFYPEIRLAFFARRPLCRMVDAMRPDYVHIATEGPLGAAMRSICLQRGWAFTSQYHTHFPLYAAIRFGSFVTGLVTAHLRRFHARSAAVMVSTPHLKAELERLSFARLHVVPLGVDTERFTRSAPPAEWAAQGPVFVYVGRLAVEKSVEEFLKADLPGTKLLIGDGPQRKMLERRYPAAIFVGYQHGHRLVSWLSCGDVFVFPSRTETFGLVILEALACGIPVAAHEVMGPRDIITAGVDGYLGDDLAAAARACLSLNRAHARETACRFTWEKAADAFAAHLVPVVTK